MFSLMRAEKATTAATNAIRKYPAQMQILYGGSTVKKDLNIFFY